MTRGQFLLSLLILPAVGQLYATAKEEPVSVLTGRKIPLLTYGLRPAAAKAFAAMKKEAAKEGVKLHITSGYRGYEKQLDIWNKKYERYKAKGLKGMELIRKITEYSALPGASRHHWGTDADILDLSVIQPVNPLSSKHYTEADGVYYKMYSWMKKNASKFGFYEAYTNETDRSGYEFEPWHYSYAPLSVDFLKTYNEKVALEDLKFPNLKGVKYLDEDFFASYKKQYVNGINQKLKP